ncbi:DUF2059 domain-containing protein [Nitrospina watsonii]|uniref:DUF2059 domain-containing protein n=1 Tax=Nitrospina watsonii TaxID=1323948 RepID=A0ABM9HFZ7_9BACT|nr:hypothetical protein [Nitrospina watsonii]CAI2719145.1 conserved protein of unknown function [Nitrospina watsonii]
MNWIKNGVVLAAGLAIWGLLGAGLLHADIDPEKERDIRKLLRVSGIYQQLDYMKEGVLNSYGSMVATAYPDAPQAFWDDFYDLIGEEEMKTLIDRVVPVYDHHMSHEVIQQLIGMFENPFWEEWKKKMPIISREAGQAGSDWSQELMQSKGFRRQVDALVEKHKLEASNSANGEPRSQTE